MPMNRFECGGHTPPRRSSAVPKRGSTHRQGVAQFLGGSKNLGEDPSVLKITLEPFEVNFAIRSLLEKTRPTLDTLAPR